MSNRNEQTRRAFAGGPVALVAALTMPFPALGAVASSGATNTAGAVRLTTTEKLSRCTVFLYSRLPSGLTSFGTGFIFGFLRGTSTYFPAVITNGHVVDAMKDCSFQLIAMRPDGFPDPTDQITITIPDVSSHCVRHPNPKIDLVAIPIWDHINQIEKLTKKNLFIVFLSTDNIPNKADMDSLTPLEDILTIGYPDGVRDNVNDLPVLHKGITASPAYIDFQGEKQFLIDVSPWNGASGSPVFLYESGSLYNARTGNVSLGGERLMLLGVARQVVSQDLAVTLQKDNGAQPMDEGLGHVLAPTNLGVCIRSQVIVDFEDELVRLGAKRPDGYQKRDLGYGP